MFINELQDVNFYVARLVVARSVKVVCHLAFLIAFVYDVSQMFLHSEMKGSFGFSDVPFIAAFAFKAIHNIGAFTANVCFGVFVCILTYFDFSRFVQFWTNWAIISFAIVASDC